MLREETVEPATLELLKKITLIPALAHFRFFNGKILSLLYRGYKIIAFSLLPFQNLEKEKQYLLNSFNLFTSTENKIKTILQCYSLDILLNFYQKR